MIGNNPSTPGVTNMYGFAPLPPLTSDQRREMAGANALPGQEIVPDVGREQPAGEIPPQPPEVPSVRDEIVGPSTIPSATPELPTEVAEFDFDEGQLPPSEFSLLINRRIRRFDSPGAQTVTRNGILIRERSGF